MSIRVKHPDAHRNPEMVAHCIAMMVDWAKSKDMSAATFVLVPSEKEMKQVVTEWLCFSQRKRLPFF